MNNSHLLQAVLSHYISTAFDNEELFLRRFWSSGKITDLLECYMGSDRTKLVVLFKDGTTVTDTIPTDEFIEWADNLLQEQKNNTQTLPFNDIPSNA